MNVLAEIMVSPQHDKANKVDDYIFFFCTSNKQKFHQFCLTIINKVLIWAAQHHAKAVKKSTYARLIMQQRLQLLLLH